jgi:hypothetical protein
LSIYYLDLAEAIGYSHDTAFTSFVQTQGTEVSVELPEGRTGRQALLEDIVKLATKFISLGITNALGYTHAVLQVGCTFFVLFTSQGLC